MEESERLLPFKEYRRMYENTLESYAMTEALHGAARTMRSEEECIWVEGKADSFRAYLQRVGVPSTSGIELIARCAAVRRTFLALEAERDMPRR